MDECLKLELLGGISLQRGGRPLTGFISNKVQALLCYLAITGRRHSRSELADLFWGERPEREARANLRVALVNLRQLAAPYVTIDRQTVSFNRQSRYDLDVAQFETSVQQHGNNASEKEIAPLRTAVKLYQGDLMPGLHVQGAPEFEDWLVMQREMLRRYAVCALQRLTAHYTLHGEFLPAINYSRRLLDLEPWHEEAHRQLMLLLSLSGQRSAALVQYEACYRILVNELGIEPDRETTALYQHILTETTHLLPGIANSAVPRWSGAAEQCSPPLAFVGRGAEFARLMHQWEDSRLNRGGWTLIEGEVGVGKTRLIEEFLRYATASGALLLRGRCSAFEDAMPYQPLVDVIRGLLQRTPIIFDTLAENWLIELTRLLPELHERYPNLANLSPIHDEMSRQRLFEALARLLEALTDIEPLPVLFIDDLHNAEPATIDLLRYLLCRLSQTAFWWVGAYRSDEIDETHALLRLRHAMEQQQRVALITLLPLESQAITQLAGVILGAEHHQIADLVAYLSDLSGGNAFLLEQFFRELERCGILSAGKDGMMLDGQRLTRDGIGVPAGVRAMIAARLGRLTSQAREVLRIAAVIGGSFHLSMLAPVVTQTTQELEESIELLLARGLIREIYCLSAGADPFPRTLLTHSPTLLDHGLFPTTLASGSTAYEFVYQATQQVIYANLSQGYRQRVIAALQQTQQQYAQQALPRWMPA